MDFLPLPDRMKEDAIRELTPDEIKTVEHVFADRNQPLPDPQLSTFVGVLREGKVVAFLVLQVRLHAEPLWIEEGHSGVLSALVSKSEKIIIGKCGPQWVYLFAPSGRVSMLAQKMGMQLEPWCVFSKLVEPEVPAKAVVDDVNSVFTDHGEDTGGEYVI